MFELGNGEQNHNLRKRKPVLLSEEQMTNRTATSKTKKSLKDIADELNAVNKNITIEKAFEKQKAYQNDKKYKDIFSDESWTYSQSLSMNKKK